MKVELRKVQVAKFASEETTCYAAEVWVDDKLVGYSKNDGKGGSDIVHSANGADVDGLLRAYAATLPPRHGRPADAENVLADALDVAIARKELARGLKTRVYLVDGDVVKQTRTLRGAALTSAIAHHKAEGKAVVLNDLPFEQAFALFYSAVAPEDHPLRGSARVTAYVTLAQNGA